MKCPKCHYISFDEVDCCRNCGYDFRLASPDAPPPDLSLREESIEAPSADLPLSPGGPPRDRAEAGADHVARPGGASLREESIEAASADLPLSPGGPPRDRAEAGADHVARPGRPPAAPTPTPSVDLPLFDQPVPGLDDTPLLSAPAPPRVPLGVRRPAAEPARASAASDESLHRQRAQPTRRSVSVDDTARGAAASDRQAGSSPADTVEPYAGAVRRVGAALLDALILCGINCAVLYFTLQLTAVEFARLTSLPLVPLIAFLLLLNGGYVVGFTTASGQTIGKMITGVRVVGEHTARVALGNAIVRAAATLLTLLSLGIGYLPALGGPDRRALHDRIAKTRVLPR